MKFVILLYIPYCGSCLCKQNGKAEGEIKAPSSFQSGNYQVIKKSLLSGYHPILKKF